MDQEGIRGLKSSDIPIFGSPLGVCFNGPNGLQSSDNIKIAADGGAFTKDTVFNAGVFVGTSVVTSNINGYIGWASSTKLYYQYLKLQPLTVAGLPSAATAGVGARAFVTDASGPAFGVAVVGGGAVKAPVYSDGTTWLVG